MAEASRTRTAAVAAWVRFSAWGRFWAAGSRRGKAAAAAAAGRRTVGTMSLRPLSCRRLLPPWWAFGSAAAAAAAVDWQSPFGTIGSFVRGAFCFQKC